MTLRAYADALRGETIALLAVSTRSMMLDPEPGKDPHTVVNACKTVLESYYALVQATTTSSSPAYAERDLPECERESLAGARHNLRVLDAVYAKDKPMPTSTTHLSSRPQA